MSRRKHPQQAKLAILGASIALAAVVSLVALNATAQAHTDHTGLNFWIEAVGQDCDTSSGDATCFIDPGTTFTLNVNLDPLPQDIPNYNGFDAIIHYSGLTTTNTITQDWPECTFPAQAPPMAGVLAFACATADPPLGPGPSTYTGVLGTVDFTCDASGNIQLMSGPGNTDLVDTQSIAHDEGGSGAETLNITCGQPPTVTPTAQATAMPTPTGGVVPTALPSTGLGTDAAGDGSDATLWAIIGVLASVAALGTGAVAWRATRR